MEGTGTKAKKQGEPRGGPAARFRGFTSLQGVAAKTAAPFLAELWGHRNSGSYNDMVALSGLDPAIHQSGKFEGVTNDVEKRGSTPAEGHPWHDILRHPIHRFAQRLKGADLISGITCGAPPSNTIKHTYFLLSFFFLHFFLDIVCVPPYDELN